MDESLILHWNGIAWKQVRSPDPSHSGNFLFAVAATGASDVWAVGTEDNGSLGQAYAVHCC